ncbi:hypothetical protein AB833_20915 [Chromatiales bacterium (ex Bugula neritina AB1)]|nr:hypothetical protein AB833_20915 [Chromatiales bacterium (ex Bugula neritina AB1)]
MPNAAQHWFGDSFAELLPLLQQLHTRGGTLSGEVEIAFGRGVAGVLGRRVARKLGIPVSGGENAQCNTLQVIIKHSDSQLFWDRNFNNTHEMKSVFKPHGRYPSGYWSENTGALALQLHVEIIDGSWHWVQKSVSIKGIPLPMWLLPRTVAYKTVIDGNYVFSVTVTAPLLGKLLSYSGHLNDN